MSTNDYVKYITQTVVKYMDKPKIERKQLKSIRKEENRGTFIFRWFGIIPYSIYMLLKKSKKGGGS